MSLLILSSLTAAADDKPSVAAAFARAADTNLIWVPWAAIDARAAALAKDYGAAAVPFLKERLTAGPIEYGLASLTLAKLAADEDAAAELLRDPRVMNNGNVRAVQLAVHFPPATRREFLDARLRGNPTPDELRLAGAIGDARTLRRLGWIAERGAPNLAPAVESAAAAIRQRLALAAPIEREVWAAQQMSLLKTELESGPGYHDPGMNDPAKAAALRYHGVRFATAFLKAQLSAGGDSSVVVLIAGEQKEASLIDDLARVAKGKSLAAQHAQIALGMVGTDKALRTLEGLFVPGPRRLEIHGNVSHTLAGYGDAKALAFLGRLKDDPRFTDVERKVFTDDRQGLERRLKEAEKATKPKRD